MSVVSRGIIYSLVAVVVVLLLGITALLGVAYHRHQRLEDATIDFQRSLTQQESKIVELQARLDDCDTVQTTVQTDTAWSTKAQSINSRKALSQAPPPKW